MMIGRVNCCSSWYVAVVARSMPRLSFIPFFPILSCQRGFVPFGGFLRLLRGDDKTIWCIGDNHHVPRDCLTYRLQRYLSESSQD